MTRVIIVHRWDGSPETDWYPWLKREIESRGGECLIPAMPDSGRPQIEPWVSMLASVVGKVDRHTYLVGHSVGCQTILRFIERLPDDEKVGGSLLVAPWTRLKPQPGEGEKEKSIALPWIETPIDWKKVIEHNPTTTCLFSENDSFVHEEDAELFRNRLNADILMEKELGHFTIFDGVTRLPMALHVLEKWGIFPDPAK
ncbi:MAG: alpha/beta hydrolase [archaeon]